MTARKNVERDWVALLETILSERPSLPGAACIGRHELFDEDHDESNDGTRPRQAAAEKLCAGCPEAWQCPERQAQQTEMMEAKAS
ncbi:hypothetical protein P3H15_33245 [Rhodococcus sp. T2V]|uniref:hypothetical protein n=1 Tax=Rhodococcus sp. T2V TaxID=3034164 RepID=UPI0023E0D0BA|nr:hypothetical protein [Rhodococcus sp. T2V]MDF3309886.1 hypothetical protein [Rhodococcus sp. T2V]